MSSPSNRLLFALLLGAVTLTASVAFATSSMEERLDRGDHIHGLYPGKDHVVVHGDTLWDLSGEYLKDPFIWPEIWQVNPQIEDPDRIYPGNQVQLPGHQKPHPAAVHRLPHLAAPAPAPATPATTEAKAGAEATPAAPVPPAPVVATTDRVARSGWLAGLDEEIGVGSLLGSWHARHKMFATDAAVYVSLGSRDGVVAGDRFQVVQPGDIVRHPQTGEPVGRLVRVVGEVVLTEVHETTATGRIVRAFAPMEAGDRILPVPSPPPTTERVRDDGPEGLKATVLATPDKRVTVAADDVIFLDVGTAEQVRPGDHFYLVHDATSLGGEGTPLRYASEAVVVDARAHTCTALITRSLVEAFVGDRATYAAAPLPDIYHQ